MKIKIYTLCNMTVTPFHFISVQFQNLIHVLNCKLQYKVCLIKADLKRHQDQYTNVHMNIESVG